MSTSTFESAAVATNRHYDLPSELFATFLGRRMKYTCGLYADADTTLDEAQEAKLQFIARCLDISGGESVLDVGAGWGGLSFYLAEEFGCEVTAVTPSAAQTDYLSGQENDRVHVLRRSVHELGDLPDRSFDAVALVGVIEHMPDHHEVMRTASRLLRKDGRLYVSASCYRNQASYAEYQGRVASRHVAEDVFGFADLRPLSSLLTAVEDAGLSLVTTTDLTPDYHRTVEDWLTGVRAGRAVIDGLRPGYTDELVRYLETTNAGWGRTTKHYALAAAKSRLGHREVLR